MIGKEFANNSSFFVKMVSDYRRIFAPRTNN